MPTTETPTVSVVIPAYNASQFIVETVESVLRQSFTDFELLIINDGSPDTESLERVLEPYMQRIRYLRQRNGGPAAARNEGIRVAKGTWVAFLDGDDLWDPEYLESQLAAAHRDSLDLVYCDMRYFGPGAPLSGTFATHNPSAGPVTPESLLAEKCTVLTSTVVVRRVALLTAGLFDTSFIWSEDFDLWMRILVHGYRVGYQTAALGQRRVHAQALTSDEVSLLESLLRVYDNFERLPRFPRELLPLLEERRGHYRQQIHELRFRKHLLEREGKLARQHLRAAGGTRGRPGFLTLYLLSYVPILASGLLQLQARLTRLRANRRARANRGKRVLLMGYYGARNLGDEMMLFCLKRWLAQQQASITVLSEYPEEIQAQYGLPVVQNPVLLAGFWRGSLIRPKARRLYSAIRAHDALIAGGGDLIRDDQGWGCFLFTIEKILLALLLGRTVYLVNIGIGQPTRATTGKLLFFCLRRCRGIIVRDKRSLALCNRAGAGLRAHLAPDIVLALPDWLGRQAKPVPRNLLLICLRSSSGEFGRYSLNESRLRNLVAQVEKCATNLNLEIVFVPFQSRPDSDDHAVHRQAARFLQKARSRFVDWSVDFSTLTDLFASARLVLAMRLHAAVLAASTGTPFLFLPYDHKVDEFAGDYPWAKALLDSSCDNPAELDALFGAALDAKPLPPAVNAAAAWKALHFFPDDSDGSA